MSKAYRVLVIGETWHGSDCTGLARGLRTLGHAVDTIGSDECLPRADRALSVRVMKRLLLPMFVTQFNKYIFDRVSANCPDFIVVFKGNYVRRNTLSQIRQKGPWLCNFYPDVSFMCHKSVDPSGFRYYDHIFTTKSFGIHDFSEQLGIRGNVSFLPPGFDPYVHRPLVAKSLMRDVVDTSFIGTYSPHKRSILEALVRKVGSNGLRVWGDQWTPTRCAPELRRSVVGHAVYGDYYSLAIACSRINISLLSERREGASSGDQITSRTFQIPACGGFMLHERTNELLEAFDEGTEVACFSSCQELIDKVGYYLKHEQERCRIAEAGYLKCINHYSWTRRAESVVQVYEANRGIKEAKFS